MVYASAPFIPATSVTQVDPRISVAYIARAIEQRSLWHHAHSQQLRNRNPSTGWLRTGLHGQSEAEAGEKHQRRCAESSSDSSDKAVFDVTYFYNRFKDQIITLGGSFANSSTFTSANLAESRAYGLENSLRLRPTAFA